MLAVNPRSDVIFAIFVVVTVSACVVVWIVVTLVVLLLNFYPSTGLLSKNTLEGRKAPVGEEGAVDPLEAGQQPAVLRETQNHWSLHHRPVCHKALVRSVVDGFFISIIIDVVNFIIVDVVADFIINVVDVSVIVEFIVAIGTKLMDAKRSGFGFVCTVTLIVVAFFVICVKLVFT